MIGPPRYQFFTLFLVRADCLPLALNILVKKEILACNITSPFNQKLVCFVNPIKKLYYTKQPIFLLNWKVIFGKLFNC